MRLILGLWLLALSVASQAGVYTDDMAKCLVASTSQKDKTDLVRWVFANAALHPGVSSISSVTPAARDEMNRKQAALVERLLTQACRSETQAAVRYEGPIAFQLSFQVLGQVAMKELMSDKSVSSGFDAFVKYLDKAKLEALGVK